MVLIRTDNAELASSLRINAAFDSSFVAGISKSIGTLQATGLFKSNITCHISRSEF
jgi:hypothetical protein